MKKILTIFKRDKSGFSNEELKWQAKWIYKIAHAWLTVVVLLWILMLKVIACYDQGSQMPSICGSVVVCVFLFLLVYKCIIKKNSDNIRNQLKENREKEKLGKILVCIAEENVSILTIDWRILDSLFRLCLHYGVIKIVPDNGGVAVSMSVPGKHIPPCWIDSDELLEYFDVKNKEEE